MLKLNFPDYQFRISCEDDRQLIFDPVRRKFVALTPEEWVRQHLIAFLTTTANVPLTLIGVEKQIRINRLEKRFDLVVFSRNGSPLLLAECKAPNISLTEQVFDQASRYNLILNVRYFILTNGLVHYMCELNYREKKLEILEEMPELRNHLL
jgi:type I site-specific restriction endonuclease